MGNKRYQKNKPITIPIQKYIIKSKFKYIIEKEYKNRGIKLLLNLQPTEESKCYKVLLEYKNLQRKPQLYLDISDLKIKNKADIPHKYGINEVNGKEYVNMCLYYGKEWSYTMKISETIIPWAAEWIYFFEIWLITGKWCGGGKHPTNKDIEKNTK